jgi:hypothetical protein
MIQLQNIYKIWIQEGKKDGKSCHLITLWHEDSNKERHYTMVTVKDKTKLLPGSYNSNIDTIYKSIFES